jgi:adenosylcobinamide-GDP ribazoletransferase
MFLPLREAQLSETGPGGPIPIKDNEAKSSAEPPFAAAMLMCLQFYSRLPTGTLPHRKPDLDRMAPVLPLISVLIVLAPVAALLLLWWGAPPFFAAAVAVTLYVLVTGAMTEDALADAADGLFGGHTIERRLEIMKDSRHGTYGVCAIVLLIALRIAAIGSAPTALEAAGIFMAATIIARSGALWLTRALPPARIGGAAASVGRVSSRNYVIGLLLVAALSFVVAGFAVSIAGLALAALFCALAVLGWVTLCRRLVGGQTGDLVGALQGLLEIAALAAFMLFV